MTRIEPNCTHAHCRCMNLDKQCPNEHYGTCLMRVPPPQNDKNKQDFQFTMYDLRGPWADQKVKEALLPQLNAKLAAAVLLDRVQTREKERKLVLSELIDDWRVWEGDMTVTVKEVLDHLKSLLPKSNSK